MAYSDTIRSSSATFETTAGLIDGVLQSYSQQELVALINTSSAAYVDYTSSSVSVTVATGEIVEIIAQVDVSSNAPGQRVSVLVSQDGTNITPESNYTTYRNDVNGLDHTTVFTAIRTPAVGAHTYKIRWKVSAGTAYSAQSRLIVKVFQNT